MAASTNHVHQQSNSNNNNNNNYPEEKVPCENGKQILSLGCNNMETMEFHSECNSDITAGKPTIFSLLCTTVLYLLGDIFSD
jgi:hypothetical protein